MRGEIVAGQVLAVFGEFDAEALERAAVQARQQPFDDGARLQLERAQAREDRGIEEPKFARPRSRRLRGHTANPLFGTGTASSSRATMRVGVQVLGFGVEVRDDAVAQDRRRQRLDVLDRHVVPAVDQRPRLAAEDHRLRRAQAGAPLHVLVDELRRRRLARARRRDEAHRVARDLVAHDHLPDHLLELEDVGPAQHASDGRLCRRPSSRSRRAPRRLPAGRSSTTLNMKRSSCASGSG